jgi:hypothetical protein
LQPERPETLPLLTKVRVGVIGIVTGRGAQQVGRAAIMPVVITGRPAMVTGFGEGCKAAPGG